VEIHLRKASDALIEEANTGLGERSFYAYSGSFRRERNATFEILII